MTSAQRLDMQSLGCFFVASFRFIAESQSRPLMQSCFHTSGGVLPAAGFCRSDSERRQAFSTALKGSLTFQATPCRG